MALGKVLAEMANSIVENLNIKYGDHFVFGGDDALKVPGRPSLSTPKPRAPIPGRALSKALEVIISPRATYLRTNLERLETEKVTLNEQILDVEQIDLADAIIAFSWDQFCYNSALKVRWRRTR